MRRTIAIGTAAAAGVASLALVAAPAWAQAGSWFGGTRATFSTSASDPVCTGTGPTAGLGYGMRNGGPNGSGSTPGMGYGRGNGGGPGAGMMDQDAVAQGTLTADQKTTLATMADEEKMAHDLYVALAAKYPELTQFAGVATSETRHLAAVRSMLERYGIADPTAGKAPGEFATASIQSRYDTLLAGATSSTAALAAGVTVEKADIADLAAATSGLTAPDVLTLYTHLSTASQHHLTALGG